MKRSIGKKTSVFLPVALFLAITTGRADTPCVMANGKPLFVIGMYDYPGGGDLTKAHMKEMADAGINTLHVQLHHVPTTNSPLGKHVSARDLDAAHRLGLKVILALNTATPWKPEDIKYNWGSNPTQFCEGSDFHRALRRLKDHPALLMYETMDEPGGCREMLNRPTWPSLDTLKQCYRFVKSVDPVHPIWCNEVAWYWCRDKLSMQRFRAWSETCDVYSQDDYPEGGPAYPNCPLNVLGDDMDAMAQIVDADGKEPFVPAKPLLMVLQGQGWNMCVTDKPETHLRCPNKIETRFVAYASIIHGAKGILWWGCNDLVPLRDKRGRLTPRGELWEVIKSVSGELDDLKDVFITDRILTGFTLSDKRLDAAMWRLGGAHYLAVVNRSQQSVLDAVLKAEGWKPTQALFEHRKITPVGDGSWRDSFGPWDTHVYTDGETHRPNVAFPRRDN